MRNLLYAATALAAIAALPVTAHAGTISFGYSFVAGGPLAGSITSTAFSSTSIANGWTLSTSALGAPPLDQGSLDGTTINVQSTGASKLFVYITETGMTGPAGAVQFSTTFDNINNPAAGFTEIAFTGSELPR